MRLPARVALVTGAGRGIGRAIALRFAAEGARVAVNDVNPEAAAEVVSEIQAAGGTALAAVADVSDRAAVEAAVAATVAVWGGLDIVVNNAIPNALRMVAEEHDITFDVIVRGSRQVFEAALPHLRQSAHAAAVYISSVNALLAVGHLHVYSAAKAALLSYVRTQAVEHGPEGIRVNAISPGSTRTEVWEAYAVEKPTALEEAARFYPLQRIAEPTEIAAAALFLASDDASFVTGHNLVVDGGLSAGVFLWDVN